MKNLKLIIALVALSILAACKTEVDRNPTYKESNPFTDSTLDVGSSLMGAPMNYIEFRRTKIGKTYTKSLNYKADRNISFSIGSYASIYADNCKKGSKDDFELSYKVRVKSITSDKYVEVPFNPSRYAAPRINLNMDDKLKIDVTLKSGAECSTVETSFLAYESV